VYVGANALVAVFAYLVIVGPIKRVELRDPDGKLLVEAPAGAAPAH
jgi:ACS family glucarate transporter-like MFS transporter